MPTLLWFDSVCRACGRRDGSTGVGREFNADALSPGAGRICADVSRMRAGGGVRRARAGGQPLHGEPRAAAAHHPEAAVQLDAGGGLLDYVCQAATIFYGAQTASPPTIAPSASAGRCALGAVVTHCWRPVTERGAWLRCRHRFTGHRRVLGVCLLLLQGAGLLRHPLHGAGEEDAAVYFAARLASRVHRATFWILPQYWHGRRIHRRTAAVEFSRARDHVFALSRHVNLHVQTDVVEADHHRLADGPPYANHDVHDPQSCLRENRRKPLGYARGRLPPLQHTYTLAAFH